MIYFLPSKFQFVRIHWLAIAGVAIGLIGVLACTFLYPGFDWTDNALSDMGRVGKPTAPLYNGVLLISGALLLVFSSFALWRERRVSWSLLLLTSVFLQMVATYDEAYGLLHGVVSVLFFLCLGFYVLAAGIERRSPLAVATFFATLAMWILHYRFGPPGVAIPEYLSALLGTGWVLRYSLEVH